MFLSAAEISLEENLEVFRPFSEHCRRVTTTSVYTTGAAGPSSARMSAMTSSPSSPSGACARMVVVGVGQARRRSARYQQSSLPHGTGGTTDHVDCCGERAPKHGSTHAHDQLTSSNLHHTFCEKYVYDRRTLRNEKTDLSEAVRVAQCSKRHQA